MIHSKHQVPVLSTARRAPSSVSPYYSFGCNAATARYSFHPLSEPIPLSPYFPPKHNKGLRTRYHTTLGILSCLLGFGLVAWIASIRLGSTFSRDAYEDEGVANDPLPLHPSVIIIKKGIDEFKWTISIPPTLNVPLRPQDSSRVCSQVDDLQVFSRKQALTRHRSYREHGYYNEDKSFVDVAEAQQQGYLTYPDDHKAMPVSQPAEEQDSMGEDLDFMRNDTREICKKSLTYAMESSDAGFGKTIMGLWMAYGLAKKEHRAFFIDDTNWAYGKYTTYFQPPPSQSCGPPPREQQLPCPHQASHLLVSASTAKWTFGPKFKSHFEKCHASGVHRQEGVFALLRTGYEALFHLATADATSVTERGQELDKMIRDKGHLIVGIHVRRGDRHPWEIQYEDSYIPFEKYLGIAQAVIAADKENMTADAQRFSPTMIIASDDPNVYSCADFLQVSRAQSQIQLASKAALDAAAGHQSHAHGEFVEENVGWEGGFFQDVFWGLGRLSRARTAIYDPGQSAPSESAMQLRTLVGRAYLLDIAVLGHSDVVICGASSVSCRLLAVMMGWDAAIDKERWKNVDGNFRWTGIDW